MSPAGPVVAVFAILGLAIAGLSRGASAATDSRYRQLEAIVQRARAGTATPAELRAAAELAHQLGQDDTAQRLLALAASLERTPAPAAPIAPEDLADADPGASVTDQPPMPGPDPVETEAPQAPAPPPTEPALMPPMTSPLAQATDAQWQRFVRTMGSGKVDTVTRSYNLGIFRQGFPTLEALGVATNVRKGRAPARGAYDGEHNVWIGDWVPPLTLDAFLGDPALQYRLFSRNVVALYELLAKRHGVEIDAAQGARGTLSGLLAVALVAGPRGWEKWWKEWPADGGPHPNTNANTNHAFTVANGLF